MATHKEVAEHLGLSERQILNLKKNGTIPGSKTRGGMDLDQARLSYINYLRGLAKGEINKPPSSLEEEKVRLTSAQADEKELQVQLLNGEIIRAEEALEEWSNAVLAMRAKLIALPGRLASKSMTLKTVREVEEYARSEIYLALDEIATGDI